MARYLRYLVPTLVCLAVPMWMGDRLLPSQQNLTVDASSRLLSAAPRNSVSILYIAPTVGSTDISPRHGGLETFLRTIKYGSLSVGLPPSIWSHTMTVTRENAGAGSLTPKGNTIGDENLKVMVLRLVLKSPEAIRGEGFLRILWHS